MQNTENIENIEIPDKIVIICAVGRSGSTTLQLILNTIPNSNICGENNGAIIHLLEFYKQIKYTQQKVQTEFKEFSNDDKKNISKIFERRIKPAWFNTFDLNEIKTCIQRTIVSMFKKNESTNVWGFKEIRYHGKLELLKEFRELFPQTKVILNIRENIQKQSTSSWFKNDPNSLFIIKKQTDEIIDFYKSNRDFCFLNTLEKMYTKNHLENLFKFIGCCEHFNERKVKSVLINTIES
jgi:hypothetical protein